MKPVPRCQGQGLIPDLDLSSLKICVICGKVKGLEIPGPPMAAAEDFKFRLQKYADIYRPGK
jgi:hypothetical protein